MRSLKKRLTHADKHTLVHNTRNPSLSLFELIIVLIIVLIISLNVVFCQKVSQNILISPFNHDVSLRPSDSTVSWNIFIISLESLSSPEDQHC